MQILGCYSWTIFSSSLPNILMTSLTCVRCFISCLHHVCVWPPYPCLSPPAYPICQCQRFQFKIINQKWFLTPQRSDSPGNVSMDVVLRKLRSAVPSPHCAPFPLFLLSNWHISNVSSPAHVPTYYLLFHHWAGTFRLVPVFQEPPKGTAKHSVFPAFCIEVGTF